ncbi:polyamine aminopropyltransferase [Tritonibacter mobilis]|uniref:polyamine aminopropyltransferase n=1 Tax=Tritonibacter mobilis TaxID=379347 RepID=UPI0014029C52|nr:polyamine aminopropyltransferase [Tritonibacter mobilis]NHM19886.1 polyamine aminopropyltransferase [Tritonibacter mobilis]NHM24067.1 polyamine aminopropyltransferase [Tritonibacter mobilis]
MTPARRIDPRELWLLLATFLVAVAGLIYELIAATLSSYLLGDSVRQFSMVIGVFLSAMGGGAWASRFVADPVGGFIWVQILLGVVGGFLAPILFLTYASSGEVGVMLYSLLILVGLLSGMEIPLIARVLESIGAERFRFENVLSVDYIGALVASLAFPLLVVPQLGLMSASLAFGVLNLVVAGLSLWVFRQQVRMASVVFWAGALVISLGGLWQSERLVAFTEAQLFEDEVILSETTPYQNITITRFKDRIRLFLNHSIQFDSLDEHRYHELLVHPAMASAPRRASVLILGGGDGLAAREVLKYDDVARVALVDLDPRVTEIFAQFPDLTALNDNALNDPRSTVFNQDAWRFVEESRESFDVILIDLPDPKTITLSKLYTRQFYRLLSERMSAQGIIVTQAGSPLFARQAFWSIVETFESTEVPQLQGRGWRVTPYHGYVPSFGEWGFVMATTLAPRPIKFEQVTQLSYLTPEVWQAAQVFGADSARLAAQSNTMQSHALVQYYLDGWDYWFR